MITHKPMVESSKHSLHMYMYIFMYNVYIHVQYTKFEWGRHSQEGREGGRSPLSSSWCYVEKTLEGSVCSSTVQLLSTQTCMYM